MRENKILFSIILPAYNRARQLPRAINSFLAQNSTVAELIVVDDGSTDNTSQILSSYTDDRITIVRQENRERAASRNRGIQQAKGLYVGFLDSDDYLLENHVQVAEAFMNEHSFPPVFHLSHETRNEEGVLVSGAVSHPPQLNDLLKLNNVISCNSIFIQREIAILNPFCERRELSGTEDYELWLRIAAVFPVLHHNVLTSVIVEHSGRTMSQLSFEPVYRRITALLEEVEKSMAVCAFLGKDFRRWKAYRFRYLSLYAALGRQTVPALRYWFRALGLYPRLLLKREGYSTWFRLFSRRTD